MRKLKTILASAVAISALASAATPFTASTVRAADKVQLTFSDTVPEGDVRSKILKESFGGCLGDQFEFKPYFGATLFKQGTERHCQNKILERGRAVA
jgi:hypothetical protein